MAKEAVVEYRGIRRLVAALLKEDTLTALSYDEVFPIAGIAELSKTTENSSEPHYYDNEPKVIVDAAGSDEVTCTCAALPLTVLSKLTGQVYDEDTNTLVEGNAERPYLAIGYITEDTSGNEFFVWRLKVKCSIPDSTHATKTDGTDANGQELVFTGINTTHVFTTTGQSAKAVNHKAGTLITEDNFFKAVQDIDKLKALKK